MQAIDAPLLAVLVEWAHSNPMIFFTVRWLTELGGARFLLPLTALVAALLAYAGHRRRALALLFVVTGGRGLVELLKCTLGRPRPRLIDYPVEVHSLSFPSGHAGNSTVVYLAIALIAAPLIARTRWPAVAAIALAFVIGLTRPMLGVHWPSDVLAGWSLGLAWTLASVWMMEEWIRGDPRGPPRTAA